MKKTLLLLAGLSLFASQANAAILSFDDIPEGSLHNAWGQIPTHSYKGFTFSSPFSWMDVGISTLGGGTYNFGARSGHFAMFNNLGGIETITEANGKDFTFDGLWAKKWSTPKESGGADSLFGVLEGYKNGTQIWSVTTSLNGSYEYYGAQSGLIDELKLGFGARFLMDDLALTAVSPVPEPSSIALMLGGLGLVGFMAARRAKKV